MMACSRGGGGGGGGEWFISSVMVTAAGDMSVVTVPIPSFSIFQNKKLQMFVSLFTLVILYICETVHEKKLHNFFLIDAILFTKVETLPQFRKQCENGNFRQKHKR